MREKDGCRSHGSCHAWGRHSSHQIARDPGTGESKGFGFVSFHDFDAADQAIENLNGQFLGGKQVSVQYAFKKDGKGERHGTQAERVLANQAKKHSLLPGGFSESRVCSRGCTMAEVVPVQHLV